MAKFCTNCGKEIEEGKNTCSNCSTVTNFIPNQQASNETPVNTKKTNGLAITGFVLAIVSILCCGTTSVLGLIFSIIGLVNAKKYNNDGKGLAIAGIIISSIGLIILLIFNIIGVFGNLAYSDFNISQSYY